MVPRGLALTTALLALGCGSATPPAEDAGASAFARIVAQLRQTCTPCHTELMLGFLDLGRGAEDDARAHAGLLQPTMGHHCGGGGRVRVVPGQPEASVLYQKVLARSQGKESAACGAAMPPPKLDPIPMEQIELIHSWIAAGAGAP